MTANPNLAADQKSLGKQGAFIDDITLQTTRFLYGSSRPLQLAAPITDAASAIKLPQDSTR